MTRYTLTWLEDVQNQLAQLWIDAPDKQAVTNAVNEIDRELAIDADRKGEPVAEGLRTLYAPPVHVLFSVREEDRIVEVVRVRRDPANQAAGPKNGQSGAGG